MNLKADENLGRSEIEQLRQAGHDVASVYEQKLCAAADHQLIRVCRDEHRCLITLDLDFANPLIFNPIEYPGIAVLRLPPRCSKSDLIDCVQTLIGGLAQDSIEGKLWIIQRGRIRQYQPDN